MLKKRMIHSSLSRIKHLNNSLYPLTLEPSWWISYRPVCCYNVVWLAIYADLFYLLVRHLPEWFPGAGFKQIAKAWSKTRHDTVEGPFQFVKKQMVCLHVLMYTPSHPDNNNRSWALQNLQCYLTCCKINQTFLMRKYLTSNGQVHLCMLVARTQFVSFYKSYLLHNVPDYIIR